MRTTIRIDDGLYREVKAQAVRSGRTVGELIEDAVRKALATDDTRGSVPLVPLPVFGGSGVLPGVDLTSTASLREVMERDDPVDALR